MLKVIINDPLFGLVLTILVFYLARRLFQWRSYVIFNPIILAPVLILLLIASTSVTYEQYKQGGQFLSFLLGPATVALGVPFYKKLVVIKKNYKAVLISALASSLISAATVVIIGKAFGVSKALIISMSAKAATGPIAIGITEKLGGLEQIIILSVVITGILGGIIGPEVLRFFRIKGKITLGLTLGASAHAGGTSRAILLGETEGAFSGVAMVVTGVFAAIVTPLLIKILM